MTARFALFLALCLFAACGGDNDTPSTPTRPNPIPSGPTITCPASVTVPTTTTSAQVAYAAPNVSGGTAPVTAACTPASGATLRRSARLPSRARQPTPEAARRPARVQRHRQSGADAAADQLPGVRRQWKKAGEVTVPTTTALDELGFPSFKLVVVPTAAYPAQLQTLLRTAYRQGKHRHGRQFRRRRRVGGGQRPPLLRRLRPDACAGRAAARRLQRLSARWAPLPSRPRPLQLTRWRGRHGSGDRAYSSRRSPRRGPAAASRCQRRSSRATTIECGPSRRSRARHWSTSTRRWSETSRCTSASMASTLTKSATEDGRDILNAVVATLETL